MSEKKGRYAEYLAAAFLILKGYRVHKLRYKTHVGEVDIVARKGNEVVFVEVKYRATDDLGLEAVTPKSQMRIRNAASLYLAELQKRSRGNCGQISCRFDVVIVSPYYRINHRSNMF